MFKYAYLSFHGAATLSPGERFSFQRRREGAVMERDESLQAVRALLERIRDQAEAALRTMETEAKREVKSMKWKCARCGYRKHFTRPVDSETASACPKCRGVWFQPEPL